MLRAGLAVGLGTDGAASNNDLNLWEEMDTAAKLHKLIAKDASVPSAREALEMATIRGARAIRRDRDLGSLETGKLADLIVVRMDAPHQTPLYERAVTARLCDQGFRRGDGRHQRETGHGQAAGAHGRRAGGTGQSS